MSRSDPPPDQDSSDAERPEASSATPERAVPCWRRFGGWIVFSLTLASIVPTLGDIGVTWDEPSYQYSQQLSQHWWERLAAVRSWSDLNPLLDPMALVYYWPYGYHGINFHPPLAGQLSLLSYGLTGGMLQDIVARRLAPALEFSLVVALLYGFLARRYSPYAGLVAAGALALMPRLYGHAHIAGTDMPGLLIWAGAALAFWDGLSPESAGTSKGFWERVLIGVLLGLAFLTKMAAVLVLLPLLFWLAVTRLPGAVAVWRREVRAAWLDGLVTFGLMVLPLALAGWQILTLADRLPPPSRTNLMRIPSFESLPLELLGIRADVPVVPGVVLAVPLLVWIARRVVARLRPTDPVWGVTRPAQEVLQAIVAFAPLIGWLGNPVWWRETMVRLAHYYTLNTNRRDALPDIHIIYLNEIFEYSLPWHNGLMLIAVTVSIATLIAAGLGLVGSLVCLGRDRLPLFFLVNALVLPGARMLSTPCHDGVRLFLPTFLFLAALAGLGTYWTASWLIRRIGRGPRLVKVTLAGLVLMPSAVELAAIHPYELSYYNALIGGPSGASRRGLELSYWFDAYNPSTLEEINGRLPRDAAVEPVNDMSRPPTFLYLREMGQLRSDIQLGSLSRDQFPYMWLLTQHSKASALSRLLYTMEPWYASRPRQLDGMRVASVADPTAVSRAWALWLLLDAPAPPAPEEPVKQVAPDWVRGLSPTLAEAVDGLAARFRGDGLTRIAALTVNEPLFEWAIRDPDALRRAARMVAEHGTNVDDPEAIRLLQVILRYDRMGFPASGFLLEIRPEALVEAVDLIIRRPDDLRAILLSARYLEPEEIGGYLDQDLPSAEDGDATLEDGRDADA